MTGRRWITLLAALCVCGSSANAIDLHRLWDDRCVDCHGHAGEFARQHLKVVDGELVGRHQTDLRRFLGNHYLGSNEAGAVYAMLQAQAGTEAQFAQRCSGCHQRAADFARQSLTFRGEELVGLGTGQSVAAFLRQHRGLTAEEATFFTDLLQRVRREVDRD